MEAGVLGPWPRTRVAGTVIFCFDKNGSVSHPPSYRVYIGVKQASAGS